MFKTSGFREIAHFRFEVEIGSRKVDDAEAGGELYTPKSFIRIHLVVSEEMRDQPQKTGSYRIRLKVN